MKLIAILNNKGGCGKTFVSVVLAELLMIAGKRVAVVDLDTTQLDAVKALRFENGLPVFPNLDIIPSPGEVPDYKALREYDFVIADCPSKFIGDEDIDQTIQQTDVFIIPVTVQQNALFAYDQTLEYLPDGRPVIPVCSMGPRLDTVPKRERLQLIKDEIGEGAGNVCPAVFLPWYDRVEENLNTQRDFYHNLRDGEFAKFDALRVAVLNALGM